MKEVETPFGQAAQDIQFEVRGSTMPSLTAEDASGPLRLNEVASGWNFPTSQPTNLLTQNEDKEETKHFDGLSE